MKTARISYFISILLFVGFQSFAFAIDSLTHFGAETPALTAVPKVFRVLDWNVHKGANKALTTDFATIGQGVHFSLFQEAVENDLWTANLTQAQPILRWSLVRSFFSQKESDYHGYTGVALGSMVASLQETPLISTVTEPFSNTPKTALVAEYAIEGSAETLLVINVHMINFVGDGPFITQLGQIIDTAKNHKGPLLMAGDFNTWSDSRIFRLAQAAKALGTERIPMDNYYSSPIIYPYDHIFIRGLKVRSAQTLKNIQTSDHLPLVVELEIVPPQG
ncbi:MAG: endonuclease/exonuclease/phosphatase family protein [Bdellovibrionales bacterium]|nr:endonuclease/exonuclease/phosphatase family protein [Bdellovibrionales bacterium]